MKRMTKCLLVFSAMLFLLMIPVITHAKSDSKWKIWESKTEVDIDKAWTIKFNDEVDWESYEGIKVVRERDNVHMFVEPVSLEHDQKSLQLYLGHLYDFDETYHLYIEDVQSVNGKILKEPIKMKFQTINPEFTVVQPIEKDGIKFDVQVSQTETKLFAKLKATNVSGKTITYIGTNGCDPGLKADLYNRVNFGEVRIGNKWWTIIACTEAIEEYELDPGKSIDVTEVLYLPEESVDGETFLKVRLVTGTYSDEEIVTPIEIEIPINL